MKKRVFVSAICADIACAFVLGILNCTPISAFSAQNKSVTKQILIPQQFEEWNIDEEAVKNGKNGDPAGTYTQNLLYGLAFRWNGTGTPEGAEIGGYTLTGTDGWISKDQTQVQDMEAFAAVLPGIEHYDDCTPFVPDDLKQSGLWITGGVRDAKYICALLNDPRIEAPALLYITEQKAAYVDAEDEDSKQAMISDDLSFDAISAVLRPIVSAETGDVDGDGKVTAFDASLALTGFNEATVMDYEPEERTLSPAQEQTADVDGDGVLTAFDATCILTYTNLKYNAGFDDLTWEDVLPEK